METLQTGTQPWLPNFSLVVEGSTDITEEVRANLVNLMLVDNGGSNRQSDQLSFAVASDSLKLPPKGVKIAVGLGFGEVLISKGTFVVDALSSGGSASSHRIVQVTARAYSRTNARGHSTLQSQKTRAWTNISLGDLVRTVATEHGLTAAISQELTGIPVGHLDQSGESDMNLLTRLADRYGAVSKVTHDHWTFTRRGSVTTVSGAPLKNITVTREMTARWSYQENGDQADTLTPGNGTHVIAYTDMTDGGKTKILTVGSGEPVIQYTWAQPDLASAKEIAAGFSTASQKKTTGMSLDLPAASELMNLTAQCLVTTRGFGKVEDREWHISKLYYVMSSQGFVVKMELE